MGHYLNRWWITVSACRCNPHACSYMHGAAQLLFAQPTPPDQSALMRLSGRADVMAAGCLIWGVMAIGFAFTNSVLTVCWEECEWGWSGRCKACLQLVLP